MVMPDKEKALDALQKIIELTSCHTASKVNDKVIKLSETVQRALVKVTEETNELSVSCYYADMPGHAIPIAEAERNYNECDSVCAQCRRCQ